MDQKQQTWGDFVAAAMHFLATRPDSQVLIIVEGPKGFETYRVGPSVTWARGAMKTADEMMGEIIRESRDSEVNRKIEREEAAKIDQAVKSGQGKSN